MSAGTTTVCPLPLESSISHINFRRREEHVRKKGREGDREGQCRVTGKRCIECVKKEGQKIQEEKNGKISRFLPFSSLSLPPPI